MVTHVQSDPAGQMQDHLHMGDQTVGAGPEPAEYIYLSRVELREAAFRVSL